MKPNIDLSEDNPISKYVSDLDYGDVFRWNNNIYVYLGSCSTGYYGLNLTENRGACFSNLTNTQVSIDRSARVNISLTRE